MKTLESLIKTYNDFPKNGVAFKDVLGIIQDTEAFRELIFKMSSHQLIRDSEAIFQLMQEVLFLARQFRFRHRNQ